MSESIPVRERVLLQIVAKLEAMNDYDNNGVTFQFVTREEMDHSKKFMGNSVSVLDGDEIFTYQTCYLLSTMRVGFEYWYQMKHGDTASTALGRVLAEIKKVFLSDCNLVENDTNLQLCENVRIVQSDYDIEGPDEKVVSGYAQFDFLFRTNKEDPYALM